MLLFPRLSYYLISGPRATYLYRICLSNPRSQIYPTTTRYITSTMPNGNPKDQEGQGATGAAKWVTSAVGNTVGGVTRTLGGVTGAAGRGIGDTINSATGSTGKVVGDGFGKVGSGAEEGAKSVAKGVEDAGNWKRK